MYHRHGRSPQKDTLAAQGNMVQLQVQENIVYLAEVISKHGVNNVRNRGGSANYKKDLAEQGPARQQLGQRAEGDQSHDHAVALVTIIFFCTK